MAWGTQLQPGDHLGYVGLSGTTSGPHLHWGAARLDQNPYLRLGFALLNPLELFVLPAITQVDLISYIAGGGSYVDEGIHSLITNARVVKILYPIPDPPGPTSTGG